MSAEVTIPRLGWSMEEGIFVRWLKRDGEWVNCGDLLFLLESEKATQEIESLDEGFLRIPTNAPQPGETVLVGQVIGHLLAKNESPPLEGNPSSVIGGAPAATPVAGPAARRLARQLSVPLDAVPGSGRGGRITADDVHALAARNREGNGATDHGPGADIEHGTGERSPPAKDAAVPEAHEVTITPRALRAARQRGIDAVGIKGSGRHGRIRERDVLAASAQPRQSPPRQQTGEAIPGAPSKSSATRRTIARRMVASHLATAPVTLTTRVDATNLLNLRRQFQTLAAGEQDVVPSITDLVVKLLAIALSKHPRLNARWEDEQIVELAEVRVGIAVDAEAGLLVPVLPDVRSLGLREIAARSRELIARARAGTLSTTELQGGTITVTNLGMHGVDAFTPIINPPEAAILGLGAIRREPVFEEGDRVVARDVMTLSLTFDHRVVDGAPAARFLATLRQGIENPAVWLAG